jgi:hypothetical protein
LTDSSHTDFSNGNGNEDSKLHGIDLLIHNRNLGLKPVPLSWNHKPVIDWTPVYETQEYWFDEKRIIESPKFENIATAFGRTHLKDSDGHLYLDGLDIDSEPVHKTMITPIPEISDLALKSKLEDLCFKHGISVSATTSFLDFLKQVTLVVKTKKTCGYLILWHSHTQHPHILTGDCKLGHAFEIKTDKARGVTSIDKNHMQLIDRHNGYRIDLTNASQ